MLAADRNEGQTGAIGPYDFVGPKRSESILWNPQLYLKYAKMCNPGPTLSVVWKGVGRWGILHACVQYFVRKHYVLICSFISTIDYESVGLGPMGHI